MSKSCVLFICKHGYKEDFLVCDGCDEYRTIGRDNMTTQERKDKIFLTKANIATTQGNAKYHYDEAGKQGKILAEFENQLILLQDEQLKADREVYDPNFKPKFGENYFYVSAYGEIAGSKFSNRDFCKWQIATNNIYKTREQTEKGKQAVKLISEIREFLIDNQCTFVKDAVKILTMESGDGIEITLSPTDACIIHKGSEVFGDRIKQLKDYL